MIDVRVSGGTLTVFDAQGQGLLEASGEVLLSDGRVLSTRGGGEGLDWDITALHDGPIIRLRLRNRTGTTLHVEQLRPLVAPRGYRGRSLTDLRIQQTGWQSWSQTHPPAPFEPNLESAAPPIRGPILPHRRADSQLEPWMTVLESDDGPSLLLGFLSARHQLGTLEVIPADAGGHALLAATELEGVELESGAEVLSEPLMIALGDSSDLVELYARRVGEAMQARPVGNSLSGWCSWYQLYTSVSEADVDRNLHTLVKHRKQLPLQLAQLDDGYQHEVGDWLELNDKFPHGMRPLVERIRGEGFLPGLWLAPFLLSARSHTFAAHPEWVVRDERGEPLNAMNNWGAANYALDTTHPAAMRWLADVLRTVCEDWGYAYLKLDFLYAAALRGRRYDQGVTSAEAYRRGLAVLRNAAGDRFVLGCGAPLLSSIGLVDGMRIGSDVAGYWGVDGTPDGPGLRNAASATLARLWMHGRWWANDPDCVLVRGSDTQLSLAEVQAWASIVALSGGMLFAGDDLSMVEPERLEVLARLVPPSGQAARALPPLVNGMPERLHLLIDRAWGSWHVVGVANWDDSEVNVSFDPRDFEIELDAYHAVDLWSGAYLGQHEGRLELGPLAAHGLRLLSVHADDGRPMTIGSTGHLLAEAMDLATEHWDEATRVLTLVPSGHAPRGRRGELIVNDPNGPVRRVPIPTAPIQLTFS